MSVIPVKLAVKYDPPKLALVYQKESRRYIHDFELDPEDLVEPTEAILHALFESYPEYFGQVDPEQLFKLLELIKSKRGVGPKREALTDFNRRIDDLGIYSSDEDLSEMASLEDHGQYNYEEIEREMEDNDSFEDSDKSF